MRFLVGVNPRGATMYPPRKVMIAAGLAIVSLTACQSNSGPKTVSTSSYSPKIGMVKSKSAMAKSEIGISKPKSSLAISKNYPGRSGYAGGKPVRKAGYAPMKLALNKNVPAAKLYHGSAKYICSASGFGKMASCKLRN